MALDPTKLTRRIPGAILLGVAIYYAVWGGEYSAFDLWRLDRRQRAETIALERARQQADSLAAVVDLLENDDAMIETLARERFGMIRTGEILYRFVEVGETPDTLSAGPLP